MPFTVFVYNIKYDDFIKKITEIKQVFGPVIESIVFIIVSISQLNRKCFLQYSYTKTYMFILFSNRYPLEIQQSKTHGWYLLLA